MLLGVVLLISLVVIALLGFFPGMAKDTGIAQSQIYWRGGAKPVRVYEAAVVWDMTLPNGCCVWPSGDGYRLVVENIESDSITLTDVKVNGMSKEYCELGGQTTGSLLIGAGEKKTLDVLNFCGGGPPPVRFCNPGDVVQVEMRFKYNTRYLTDLTQNGSKKLAFMCT